MQPRPLPPSVPRPEQPSGSPGALVALRNRKFRWLFFSNVAFFLAMGSQQIVRAWLAFKLTDSELALGIISFTVAVPMFLISPLGGSVADRHERRNLIVAGQAVVLASELTILTLLLTDSLRFWHLVAGSGVMGCVFPFIMPARQAIVANIVGKSGLTNAMALNMAGMNTTRVVGPAAAGFLIGLVGVAASYAVGVSLYLCAVLCMLLVGRSPPGGGARDLSIYRNVIEGVHYIRDHRLILILLLFGLVPMFLAMPFQTLLVVFADEIWQVGASGLGFLSGAAGVGGLAGSMYVAWRADSHQRVRRMLGSMMAFGCFLLLFAISPWFLLALPLVLIANVFQSIFGTLNNVSIQLLIPDHVRGRISSFLMMSFSLPLLGTLPMAAVAEVYGARIAVAIASVLALCAALLFYATSPQLRNLDHSVREAMNED